VLEETRTEWCSLRRWQESGQPRRWVAERDGRWDKTDEQALLESLWQSEFSPLDVRAVHALLGQLAREVENLRRWELSGDPGRWVESRRGMWDHSDWLGLLNELQQSDYWPLPPNEVGALLDQVRRQLADARAVTEERGVMTMPARDRGDRRAA
jgi:hypothetical protein